MNNPDRPWHEGVVRISPRGNLWVAKMILQSSTTGNMLYLTTKSRFEHERASRPDVPGGYVDDKNSKRGIVEKPKETARRETIEETNFNDITDPFHLYSQAGAYSSGGLPIDIEWYLSYISGEPTPMLNHNEHINSWWGPVSEAPFVFRASPFGVGVRSIIEMHPGMLITAA